MFSVSPLLLAQGNPNATNCTNSSKMMCIIPNVFGPFGLTLPNPTHNAHFDSDFQANFSPLGSAIGTALTLLPIASPASGFTYSFDQSTGVYARTAQSFGPVLAERAETIGKGKFYVALTYQYFSFDSLNGIELDQIHSVFKHLPPATGTPETFQTDFITTTNSINLFVSQMTGFVTVGLSNRLDLSLAVPVNNVNLGVRSNAAIHRTFVDPTQSQPHYFDPSDPVSSTTHTFTNAGHATGIWDITARLKGTLVRGAHASLALATDLRFPSGDERNFLGSGTFGVKPFLIASVSGKWAPHVNIGYQINGKSLLAGDLVGYNGTDQPNRPLKGHLPNDLFYTVGIDTGATKRLTLSFDLLGQHVFSAKEVVLAPSFTSAVPEIVTPNVVKQNSYPQIAIVTGSFNVVTGSAGFKALLGGNLLLTANLLFQLNNDGLRTRVVPLVGLSYSF